MFTCLFVYWKKIQFMSNCSLLTGQEPKLAFEDVDATELYPCVMFYSSNPGEKVRECSPVWEILGLFDSLFASWWMFSVGKIFWELFKSIKG